MRNKHLKAAPVALALVALALPNGSYSAAATATAGLLVWWTVAITLVAGRRSVRLPGGPGTAAVACLLGLAALTGLSMAWAADDGRAFEELMRVLAYTGVFVFVCLFADLLSPRSWLSGLTAGCLAIASIGLLSRLLPAVFGSDPVSTQIGMGRLAFPIGYWNGLGAICALAIVGLGWLSANAESRGGRSFATAALPLPCLCLYLTSSRGSVVALVAAAGVLIALTRQRTALATSVGVAAPGAAVLIALARSLDALRQGLEGSDASEEGALLLGVCIAVAALTFLVRRRLDSRISALTLSRAQGRAVMVAGAIAVIAVVIAVNPLDAYDSFTSRPNFTITPADGSDLSSGATGSGRAQFWDAAIGAFASQPAGGVGAGGYEAWWAQEGLLPYTVRNAHSLIFETIAELGLAGLALLSGFLIAVIAGAMRLRGHPADRSTTEALLALFTVGLVAAAVDWNWEIPAVFVPVIVVAGLLCRTPQGEHGRGRARPPLRVLAPIAVAAGVAVWASTITLATELRLRQSRAAFIGADLDTAAERARQAAAIQPWSSAPLVQLGLVEERAGNGDAAREALREAIAISPREWRTRLALTGIELRSGNVDAALAEFKVTQRLNPTLAEQVTGD